MQQTNDVKLDANKIIFQVGLLYLENSALREQLVKIEQEANKKDKKS